jgi:hypothetical protein
MGVMILHQYRPNTMIACINFDHKRTRKVGQSKHLHSQRSLFYYVEGLLMSIAPLTRV